LSVIPGPSPSWNFYRTMTSYHDSRLFQWASDADTIQEPQLEFVTSPNNPDGSTRTKITNATFTIYDHVYYWPTFADINTPVAYDSSSVALFSLSKGMGLASSRIGWAITSNKELAEHMKEWQMLNRLTLPIQSQLIAITALEHICDTGLFFFSHHRSIMKNRWSRLTAVFSTSAMWIIHKPPGSSPPAFAWCERKYGNAADVLAEYGLKVESHTHFNAQPRFARLNMMLRSKDFETLIDKLTAFLSLDA